MDRLESLSNQLSQITLYDLKSMYTQAKNVVLNVSEIESKVQEATNEDPWGASSTLMQDIANRTFNYPDFNEIMPSIYSRFMEKEAKQWRQIYKALQLLEYLIKNGSERVVDDARAHISTIKMLRSFHYIDDKGKDEGINVRNRSKEIVELLTDVEKIRVERRKAKNNKHKYIGTGNDGLGFSGGGGGRYGGFGNDSLGGGGGYSGSASYGNTDYGAYTGPSSSSSGFRDEGSRRGFEEYTAGDDETVSSPPARANSIGSEASSRPTPTRKATASTPAPPPVPEVDLLGGLDDDFSSPAPPATVPAVRANKALPTPSNVLDDDDFDDFQAAPAAPAPAPVPAPVQANKSLMDLLSQTAPTPQRSNSLGMGMQQPMSTGGSMGGMAMNRAGSTGVGTLGSIPRASPSLSSPGGMMQPNRSAMTSTPSAMSASSASTAATPAKKPASANFDDLWSMSLGTSSKPGTPLQSKSIKDLEKEKSNAGLWGGAGATKPAANNSFGSFGGGGGDDLLL